MIILFPSSYLQKNNVDESFQEEYDAAMSSRCRIILFDQPWWDASKNVSLINKENVCYGSFSEGVVYRGWMMKPDEYELFYSCCFEQGLHLLASPAAYEQMHSFQKSYRFVKDDAPKTMFFASSDEVIQSLDQINKSFNRFMIKDYVKSAKNTDFPAYFEHPSVEYFEKQMDLFKELRGSLMTGGIQIKEYLDLKKYENKTNEFRVFYFDENIISINRNSNQLDYTNNLPVKLAEKYNNLPSRFYTVDFAECSNGSFKVIETGDGGVSGLSPNQDPISFYRALQKVHDLNKSTEDRNEFEI